MADEDLCRAVGEDLTRHYPGHPWMVGCDHEAGTLAIKLGYTQTPMGMLLHIGKLQGPGGQRLALMAGGELLERFGLPRKAADGDAVDAAREHGLDDSHAITQSRGSTI